MTKHKTKGRPPVRDRALSAAWAKAIEYPPSDEAHIRETYVARFTIGVDPSFSLATKDRRRLIIALRRQKLQERLELFRSQASALEAVLTQLSAGSYNFDFVEQIVCGYLITDNISPSETESEQADAYFAQFANFISEGEKAAQAIRAAADYTASLREQVDWSASAFDRLIIESAVLWIVRTNSIPGVSRNKLGRFGRFVREIIESIPSEWRPNIQDEALANRITKTIQRAPPELLASTTPRDAVSMRRERPTA